MRRNRAAGEAVVPPPARSTMTRQTNNMAALKPFMNDTARATANRAVLFEAFVAELTSAAYHVALRHGAGTWLDLQLRLLPALAETIEQWARKASPGQSATGLEGPTAWGDEQGDAGDAWTSLAACGWLSASAKPQAARHA